MFESLLIARELMRRRDLNFVHCTRRIRIYFEGNSIQNVTLFKLFNQKSVFVQMPNIKLQSSDGEVFEVDVEIAKCSVTIKTMLEDLGMDEDEEEVVPLPNVNSAILRKVIQWATYHKDDPPPPEDDENKEKRTDDISSWDADFLKVNISRD